MGQTGTATVQVRKVDRVNEDGGASRNRFAQWTMVFFAELLSFFKPAQGIENDPLLYKFRFK